MLWLIGWLVLSVPASFLAVGFMRAGGSANA
jgi:hypothetical protein